MSNEKKQRIILDFDGVIHGYESGWQGVEVIPDPPVPGAREAIADLRETFEVVVFSSRCHQEGGVEAIRLYLELHGIEVDDVVRNKVPASASVDDRGFRFEGNWEATVAQLKGDLRPWNKKRKPCEVCVGTGFMYRMEEKVECVACCGTGRG